ncbi:MAG: hypothetical protein ACK44A_03610 [Roseateles sp.]
MSNATNKPTDKVTAEKLAADLALAQAAAQQAAQALAAAEAAAAKAAADRQAAEAAAAKAATDRAAAEAAATQAAADRAAAEGALLPLERGQVLQGGIQPVLASTTEVAALTVEDVIRRVKRRVVHEDKGQTRTTEHPLQASEVLAFKDHGTHVVVVTTDGQKFSDKAEA